jgi:protein TonB
MSVTMSAVPMSPERPPDPPAPRDPADELFKDLVVSNPSRVRSRSRTWQVSLIGHAVGILMIVLIPILWPESAPQAPDYIRALIYNPPPPPPPPLPKGTAMLEKAEPAKPVTPEPEPDRTKLTAELEPEEKPLEREQRDSAEEQAGSPTGSDMGDPAGMDIGVEGGVVGGVPGGVLGGVIGGTGDGPVLDYDQPPRAIKITQPRYPPDAFVKKIEGTVEVEILIDSSGRVARARVIRSIPLLDAAALQTVYQWVFAPAIKGGRPVATVASAPVTFRIF